MDNGATWLNAGTSTNQCYVTLGDPSTTVYHTLVHLGCKNANGQSQPDGTADSIYSEFTDREVIRVSDNQQMKYWFNGQQGAATTSELLASPDANGNCEAWSALFRDFLRIQGLAAVRVYAEPASQNEPYIMVKNWKFGIHLRTGQNGLCETDPSGDDFPLIFKGNGFANTVCIEAGINLVTTTAGDDVIAGNAINVGADGICNSAKAGNDVQVLAVGRGAPSTVCVTAGINGVLNSTLAGDDVLNGNSILTGPDGVCQTVAGGDDVQAIAPGKGQANAVCVNAGINLVTQRSGDDVISALKINTGPNGKCETIKAGNDTQIIPVGQGQPNTPCIGPGPDGTLNSAKLGDDVEQDQVYPGTAYPYLISFDVWEQPGIEGQGNDDPIGLFTCHYITLYNNQYYDPSYGTPKVIGSTKNKDYEDGALAGYVSYITMPDGQPQTRCRKNDVSPTSNSELMYTPSNQ